MSLSRLSGWLRPGLFAVLGLGAVAPMAWGADALNGKSLYTNGPVGGGAPACASCHGASPASNTFGIQIAANNPAVISNAFATVPQMTPFNFSSHFSSAEIADLAAFIGNPNVTAAPAASLSPASLSFGGTTVGQSSAALSATLSNTGNAALTLGSIGLGGAAPGDFALSGGSCVAGASIAASASCSLQLTFKPTATGARAATLTINHNASGGASTLSLSGTGNAVPQATIGLSSAGLNFGQLVTGVASPVQTVTVSNSGQAALSFTAIALGGTNPSAFTLGGTCAVGTPVAAGASCTVTVQALASAAGTLSASVNLQSNAANGAAAFSLAATGALPSPALSATPASLSFGAQTVGASAVTQNIVLSNSGNVAVTLTSEKISGGAGISIGSGNTCGTTLAVQASCTIPVTFAPTATGSVNAVLAVSSSAPALNVNISGTGTTATVAQPVLSDTQAITFADTQVGSVSAAHVTTVTNPGTVALTLATLSLSGSQAGDFALAGSCAAKTVLSPSASCTIETRFQPGAAGARQATLMLTTDSGAQIALALTGNGVAIPPPTPVLTLSSQSFDFGSQTIGATPATQSFTLSNGSGATVDIGSVVFTGPFSIAAGGSCATAPFTLAPGASCTLTIQYQPTAAGNSTGSVVFNGDSGASWTIALSGEAAAAATTPTGGSGSTGGNAAGTTNSGGGGCSAARNGDDPTLVMLVLLALGVVGWRHRAAKRAGKELA